MVVFVPHMGSMGCRCCCHSYLGYGPPDPYPKDWRLYYQRKVDDKVFSMFIKWTQHAEKDIPPLTQPSEHGKLYLIGFSDIDRFYDNHEFSGRIKEQINYIREMDKQNEQSVSHGV